MSRRISFALLAALVAAWVPGLFWGFWVDETVTWWIVHRGVIHVLADMTPGQAPLYYLLAAPFSFPGSEFEEALLRLPSLLASIGALGLMWRWSECVNGEGTGAMAAILLAAMPAFHQLATQARPYALVALLSIASSWILWEWLEQPESRRRLALYAISIAAMTATHFLAVVVLLCHATILAMRTARRKTWILWVAALTGSAILCLPLLVYWPELRASSTAFVFALPPGWLRFAFVAIQFPAGAMAGCVCLAILIWKRALDRQAITVLLAWILPLWLFFVLSKWFGKGVFIERYFVFAAPFLAMSFARLLALVPLKLRLGVLAAIFALGWQPQRFLQEEGPADLRAGMQLVRDLSLYENSPLAAPSWLIESKSWDINGPMGGYMFAHLSAYPVPNPIERVRFQMLDSEQPRIHTLLTGKWANEKRILLGPMARDPQWLYDDLAVAGFTVRRHATQSMFVLECTRR